MQSPWNTHKHRTGLCNGAEKIKKEQIIPCLCIKPLQIASAVVTEANHPCHDLAC